MGNFWAGKWKLDLRYWKFSGKKQEKYVSEQIWLPNQAKSPLEREFGQTKQIFSGWGSLRFQDLCSTGWVRFASHKLGG